MRESTPSVDNLRFGEISSAGYYLAVRVGFAFPEFEHKTLPLAWVHRYTRDGLMLYDPVIRWIYNNEGTIRWSEISLDDPRKILAAARDHGLVYGAAVSIVDNGATGLRSFGSFARDDREFTDDEIDALRVDLVQLHDVSLPPDDLTDGEIETLHLIKDGMLIKEVAFRLNLTESAVKQRIRNAKTKLDARTTAQAVTEASKYGLI